MTEKTDPPRSFLSAIKGLHLRNLRKGVYGYMWWSGLKIIIVWFLIMIPLVLLFKYLVDLQPIYDYIVNNLTNGFVLVIFFLSESFLGLLPPDIFILWASKFNSPILFATILGILSFIGGILSYFIGHWLSTRPKIKAYSERALEKYILMAKKWGGAFIVISALFPFSPFSMVVIAVSLLKYPFRLYLLFGISRIIRFVVQGVFYLKIFNLDSILNIL